MQVNEGDELPLLLLFFAVIGLCQSILDLLNVTFTAFQNNSYLLALQSLLIMFLFLSYWLLYALLLVNVYGRIALVSCLYPLSTSLFTLWLAYDTLRGIYMLFLLFFPAVFH